MNEKVFLVCIELNNRRNIYAFESLGIFLGKPKKIMENVYAVRTNYTTTSTNVREAIFSKLGSDFNIFVMKTSIDASWRLSSELDGWLTTNI